MKKRKKYKLKKGRIIIAIVLFIGILTLALNAKNIINFITLKSLDYSKTSIKLIMNSDLKIKEYSKTLDKIINTKEFNKNYVNHYLNVEYLEKESFFENVNKLIDKGYNSEEINTIYKVTENIELILNKDYNKNIQTILTTEYYKEENLERYLNYESENIVLDVNMYLDYDFYTHDINIEAVDATTLVNKYYKLSSYYNPELVAVNRAYAINERQLLTREAKLAFEEMCEAAKKDGVKIYSGSAYRSYSYQNTLYNNRVQSDGVEYANKTAAKAGYSEHQLGLSVDVLNGSWQYVDSGDEEFEWLMVNGYKYGFILRYPDKKEKITGYAYEPWHFRYLTVEVATELHEKNITLEEYVGMK